MIDLNTPIRFSRWSHIFEKEGIDDLAIYHSLNVDVVFIERLYEGLVDYLKLGTTADFLAKQYPAEKEQVLEIISELFASKFIVSVQNEDDNELDEKRAEYILPAGLETLYLVLTDQCNLRCSYCFINNNMPKGYKCKKMSWDVAKEAVDMFFSALSRNPRDHENRVKMIFFYGGEPFLNFDIFKKVVLYVEDRYREELKQMGGNFRFNTISNGTAITEEIATFLSEHKMIAVGLSLDGNKAVNDSQRKHPDGSGSFDKVIVGYKRLKKLDCNVSISCTIGEHNIDNLGDLLNLHDVYDFTSISMNLMLDTEMELVSCEYMEKASDRLLSYFEKARDKGVYEDRVMRKLKSFVSKSMHPFDCQATGNQIVCSPEGRLGICHEGIGAKSFFFGQVSKDFDFHNHELVNDWNKRSPLNIPQCKNCPAIGICGGGCAFSAWLRNGSIWSIDSRFCVHSMKTLEWLIWDLYKTF